MNHRREFLAIIAALCVGKSPKRLAVTYTDCKLRLRDDDGSLYSRRCVESHLISCPQVVKEAYFIEDGNLEVFLYVRNKHWKFRDERHEGYDDRHTFLVTDGGRLVEQHLILPKGTWKVLQIDGYGRKVGEVN